MLRALYHRRLSRKSSRRIAQRGLTMLEIMIVIAILGLVMGLVVVPKVMDLFGKSKVDIAKLAVNQYALDLYPKWQIQMKKDCPENGLADLVKFAGKTEEDLKDPWDSPYKMLCGAGQLPPGVSSGIAVYSLGADKTENTPDDVKSWAPAPK
jgi:general secretion pathway protein G